jgi:hypothetical protein
MRARCAWQAAAVVELSAYCYVCVRILLYTCPHMLPYVCAWQAAAIVELAAVLVRRLSVLLACCDSGDCTESLQRRVLLAFGQLWHTGAHAAAAALMWHLQKARRATIRRDSHHSLALHTI